MPTPTPILPPSVHPPVKIAVNDFSNKIYWHGIKWVNTGLPKQSAKFFLKSFLHETLKTRTPKYEDIVKKTKFILIYDFDLLNSPTQNSVENENILPNP